MPSLRREWRLYQKAGSEADACCLCEQGPVPDLPEPELPYLETEKKKKKKEILLVSCGELRGVIYEAACSVRVCVSLGFVLTSPCTSFSKQTSEFAFEDPHHDIPTLVPGTGW